MERHSRDSFTVATKFPAFDMKHEDEIEPISSRQLENLGMDYIDYYLLHNVQTIYYDGIDGNGSIMQAYHLFDHATCQFQPNPSYGCDNFYIKNTMAEESHFDCFGQLPEEKVLLDEGSDATELVRKAENP